MRRCCWQNVITPIQRAGGQKRMIPAIRRWHDDDDRDAHDDKTFFWGFFVFHFSSALQGNWGLKPGRLSSSSLFPIFPPLTLLWSSQTGMWYLSVNFLWDLDFTNATLQPLFVSFFIRIDYIIVCSYSNDRKKSVQHVQIRVFKFKSLFFILLEKNLCRGAIYCSWTPELKLLSSPCLVPAGHSRGRCPGRPAESLKSAKLGRSLLVLRMGFIDKWQNSKRRRFISQTRICWTLSLSDNLVIRLRRGCRKCKATLKHIMFTSASTISVSLMTAAPVQNLYFSQCVNTLSCASVFISRCSSSFTLRLTKLWYWHTHTHTDASHVVFFLFVLFVLFATIKATKKTSISTKNYNWVYDCTVVCVCVCTWFVCMCVCVCVCVPQMGGVQTPGANILNLF